MAVAPPPKPRIDFTQMIACPVCRVRVTEMCRTTTGRTRADHVTRILPRRCTCGDVLQVGKKLCNRCRAQARRENGRRGMRNTRARRKAAKAA